MKKFAVDLSNFTETHRHDNSCREECICLPPKDRLDNEYHCEPAPQRKPKYVPAIGPNRLTHYFHHPESIDTTQKSILTQLPKRVCGCLTASSDQEVIGWGLYFKEGWHWGTIYVLSVSMVLFGLIFGISWSVVKQDIQGGFAISSFLITIWSIGLGYLALESTYLDRS